MRPRFQVFFNNFSLVRRTREYITESSTADVIGILVRHSEGIVKSCSSNSGNIWRRRRIHRAEFLLFASCTIVTTCK